MRDLSKFKACLVGGAIGDALGYAVEFWQAERILREYGERGITRYALSGGKARFSDDTQMTLFTAAGLLFGATRGITVEGFCGSIRLAYLDWLDTQSGRYPADRVRAAWLMNCPGLFSPRAPGNTCLSALRAGGTGAIARPINHSKGCGGVMRVAPIGLAFIDNPSLDIRDVDLIGAQAAAITHGNELGWLPAAGLVHLVYRLASGECGQVGEAVEDMLGTLPRLFPDAAQMEDFLDLIGQAAALSHSDLPDREAIGKLGEGWVGDEALAIAVYCAMKYPADFEAAMIAAVNHNGDSDSTGAIAGNILGAFLGMEGLPDYYLQDLELRSVIEELAEDLWAGCPGPDDDPQRAAAWESKYIRCDYVPQEQE